MARNKKKSWVAMVAALTAVIGAAVAVGLFLKKKAKKIGEQLDYDGSIYYEDDDYLDEEDEAAEEVVDSEEDPCSGTEEADAPESKEPADK